VWYFDPSSTPRAYHYSTLAEVVVWVKGLEEATATAAATAATTAATASLMIDDDEKNICKNLENKAKTDNGDDEKIDDNDDNGDCVDDGENDDKNKNTTVASLAFASNLYSSSSSGGVVNQAPLPVTNDVSLPTTTTTDADSTTSATSATVPEEASVIVVAAVSKTDEKEEEEEEEAGDKSWGGFADSKKEKDTVEVEVHDDNKVKEGNEKKEGETEKGGNADNDGGGDGSDKNAVVIDDNAANGEKEQSEQLSSAPLSSSSSLSLPSLPVPSPPNTSARAAATTTDKSRAAAATLGFKAPSVEDKECAQETNSDVAMAVLKDVAVVVKEGHGSKIGLGGTMRELVEERQRKAKLEKTVSAVSFTSAVSSLALMDDDNDGDDDGSSATTISAEAATSSSTSSSTAAAATAAATTTTLTQSPLASLKVWGGLERRLLEWHLANIEYSAASHVDELSLRHWDQDSEVAFEGAHCVIREG
jgi:hypothetical protein